MKKIAIFCGGNSDVGYKYISEAKKFVEVLADANIGIVYGGGSTGIMGAIADHMIKLNGDITGVMPQWR
jgi:predicted Rossmann-fold nucleotide-binding protein